MVSVVFDTNILIDHLKGIAAAGEELDRYPDAGISIVSWVETMVGAADVDDEAMLKSFLNGFTVIPIELTIAEIAARLRRDRRLKLPDAIILASALSLNVPLMTRNTKDFPEGAADIVIPYRL